MKQPHEEEENVVGKALYDLIQIFQEIDREMKKKGLKTDEVVLKRKKEN